MKKYIYCFIVIIFMSSCIESENQKINQVFDQFSSKTLNRLINPPPVGAVEENVENQDQIKVAVIDNGVDYNHPYLRDKMAYYKDSEGRIKLLGYDFMGGDELPHPTNFKMDFFHLGVEKIENGRLKGAKSDPLRYLLNLNKQFFIVFKRSLNQKQLSENSLFSKFNQNNYTIPGALNLIAKYHRLMREYLYDFKFKGVYQDFDKFFEAGNFEKVDEELNQFISGLIGATKEERLDYFSYLTGNRSPRIYKDLPFQVDLINGFPLVINQQDIEVDFKDSKIEHAKWSFITDNLEILSLYLNDDFLKFIDATKDALKQVKAISSLKYYFIYYARHIDRKDRQYRTKEVNDLAKDYEKEFMSMLEKPNQFFADYSRFLLWKESLQYLSINYFKWLIPHRFSIQSNKAIEQNKNDPSDFHWYSDLYSYDPYTYLRRVCIKVSQSYFEKIKSSGSGLLAEFKKTGTTLNKDSKVSLQSIIAELFPRGCESIPTTVEKLSEEQFNFYHKFHPYLDFSGHGINHGTHVSGMVVAQDDRIRIVPVRVRTHELINSSGEFSHQIADDLFNELMAWLDENPILKSFVLSLKTEEALDLNDAETIEDIFHEVFEEYLTKIIFVNELIKAVKWVGDQDIPIANISLGWGFKLPSVPVDELYDFKHNKETLVYEFMKYRMGKAFRYAKNTIFFIAAGNQNMGIDSTSNASIPCDLSISKKYRDADLLSDQKVYANPANIVCVQSISNDIKIFKKKDEFQNYFSGYTNKILTRINKISAPGEEQYSSIKHNTYITAYKILDKSIGFNSSINRSVKIIEKENNDKWHMSFLIDSKHLKNLFLRDHFNDYDISYAAYSGTSMASPNATGFFASNIYDVNLSVPEMINKLVCGEGLEQMDMETDVCTQQFKITGSMLKSIPKIPLHQEQE